MDLDLQGYRFIRRLRRSSSSEVWSALREADQRPVVAKVFPIEERAGLEQRVEHEFELIRRLDVPGVVRALSLERSGKDLILVLEAHAGVDLAEFQAGRGIALERFFDIAVQVSAILAEVHAQRVIHRDLKPSNILITPDTGAVALADFGISVLLESERGRMNEREVVEGTLPYMAPEQTGRTSRPVDFRSDLYALGVTFYELLTGRRPFEASTPLELIHAQLALRPLPPQRLRPDLPTPLAELVMKLLEKEPERRYQSARGLHGDLLRMREALRSGKGLDELELGRGDASLELQLPHQLYGREREVELLRASFRQAAAGESVLTLIVGEPGVGKSALIDELVEPVLAQQGFLARGKFEPDSDQPFSGVHSALTSLADQLLTASSAVLERWRERLHDELAGFAPIVCELVPRFGAVLEPVGPGRELGPIEARNQVQLACARLLACFAKPEHPLALALDDLQWADASSLALIDALLAESSALLIVATTRSLEPEQAELLARLRARDRPTPVLELTPLEPEPLGCLIADALSRTPAEVAPLTEIIARKTGSNPFFVRQFLLHLHEEGLLERRAEGWVWDQAELDAAALPEDALAMMMRKLERLAPGLRELITVASVLGSEFDPLAVERVSGGRWIGAQLHTLVDEGLLVPLAGRGYGFAHDRIREAAYALLGEQRRRELHRAVGQDLLARLDEGERERRVFELVEHLDRGFALHAGEADELPAARVRELAELNLRVGRRALRTGAPHAAQAWFEIAVRLLPRIEPRDLELDFAATIGLASAEILVGELEQAEQHLLGLLAGDPSPRQLAEIVVLRMRLHMLAGDQRRALSLALVALPHLGVAMPMKPGRLYTLRALVRIVRLVRPAAIERWRTSKPMSDPKALAAADIMTAAVSVAYTLEPELFLMIAERLADLFARAGDHPQAVRNYAQLALVLANAFGRRREAIALTERCIAIARERGDPQRMPVLDVEHFLRMWTAPLHELSKRWFELAERHVEAGDIEAGMVDKAVGCELALYGGVHLRIVAKQTEARLRWSRQWGLESLTGAADLTLAVCHALLEGPVPDGDASDAFGLDRQRERVASASDLSAKVMVALALAVFERWAQTRSLLRGCFDDAQRRMPGTWLQLPIMVLEGLAAIVAGEPKLARRHRARLRAWTQAGGNFAHAEALLSAELFAHAGRLDQAIVGYRRAAELAAAQRNTWIEALVHERMAIRMAERDEQLALGPLRRARELYLRWGAFAKVEALEQAWPGLRELGLRELASSTSATASTPTSSSTTSSALDSASLVKTALAITEDLRLEQVVTRIIAIAIENAGAVRGVLLLANAGELWIAAEADAEAEAERAVRSQLAQLVPLDAFGRLPTTLLRWAARTRETVILSEAGADPRFAGDPYLRTIAGASLLCLPIVKQRQLVGLLYLENHLSAGAFAPERVELLRVLAAQAASALDNARLYDELRTSEVRWRSLVEQLPDVVVLVDRSGKPEFVNMPQLGTDVRELVVSGFRAQAGSALLQVFDDGRQRQLEFETVVGGVLRWFAVRMAPIVVDGRIDRVIVVATDISERKQAELERQRLELQLRQQQRLESIGTLASGVAHEINNPIQGIMNYAELIACARAADEEIREFAGEIEHETKRVSTIVRNLLAFSRHEQGQALEPSSAAEIVEGTVSLIQAVLRKDQIELVIDIPPGLPPLHCRPQQIQQVVMNLVTNARDALNARFAGYHPDKRIMIDAREFARGGERWIALRVGDRGGGIPVEVVARIFDPFFTTKGRDQGTGLGLAVSHGIVSEHGGVLGVENRPGEGAWFSIELPADGYPVDR